MAVAHFRDVVVYIASVTPEDVEVTPDLPVDLSPRDPVGFSDEGHELLQVPRPVDDVLGSDLSVSVDVGLGLAAVEDLALTHREQLVAVRALVEVVALLL